MAEEYADQLGNDDEDEIPSLDVQCTICGGTNYFMIGGFYYCATCQTQSQESRLFLEEENYTTEYGSHHRSRLIVADDLEESSAEASQPQRPGQLLTAWEVHNLAIKVIADNLIELGYPAQVKEEILQLWCSYLKRRKVILVSKTGKGLSTFTRGEPALNVRAILGLNKRKRKSPKKTKKEQSGTAIVEKRRSTRLKSKAFEEDYVKTVSQSQNTPTKQENDAYSVGQNNISMLQNCDAEDDGKVGGKLCLKRTVSDGVKSAKKLRSIKSDSGKNLPNDGSKISWRSSSLLRAETFTISSVLQLVYMALRVVGCKVLVSDVIRLYREGSFRVSSLEQLLPDSRGNLKDKNTEKFLCMDPELSINSYVHSFVTLKNYVGLDSIVIYPNFFDFLPKFIDDWKLPRELEYFIHSLNRLIPVETFIRRKHRRIAGLFPEMYIFSIICVVLKLIFGLDDETEKHQSKFASVFNKLLQDTLSSHRATRETLLSAEWSSLFVFNDWLRIMRLREKLVRQEYVPQLNRARSKQAVSSTVAESATESSVEPEACRSIEALLRRSAGPQSQQSETQIVSSTSVETNYTTPVLPLEDIVKTYLSRNSSENSLNDGNFSSLCQDFSKCRIDYVFSPEKYVKILAKMDITVQTLAGNLKNCELNMSDFTKKTRIPLFQPYKRFQCCVQTKVSDLSGSLRFLLEQFAEFTFLGFSKVQVLEILLSIISDLEDIICRRSLLDLIPIVP